MGVMSLVNLRIDFPTFTNLTIFPNILNLSNISKFPNFTYLTNLPIKIPQNSCSNEKLCLIL